MKTLLIILISATFSMAQMPMDSATHKFTYSEVVEVPGMLKNELYVAARSWFVEAYKSADDVIQMDDKEAGKIMGKGILLVKFQGALRQTWHTVQIDVKDGKYRYTFTTFILKFSDVYKPMEFETIPTGKFWGLDKLYTNTDAHMISMVAALKTKMHTTNKKEDW